MSMLPRDAHRRLELRAPLSAGFRDAQLRTLYPIAVQAGDTIDATWHADERQERESVARTLGQMREHFGGVAYVFGKNIPATWVWALNRAVCMLKGGGER